MPSNAESSVMIVKEYIKFIHYECGRACDRILSIWKSSDERD